MSVTYSVSGPVNGGPANRLLNFTVDIKVDNQIPKQCKKSDLRVVIEGPSNANVSIMGGDRANFKVGFTPTAAGTYWADFVFKGTWANKPHKFPISDGTNCPEIEYEGKYRSGNAPLPLTSSDSVIGATVSSGNEEKKKREEEDKQKEEQHRRDLEDRKRREDEDRKRKANEEDRKRQAEADRLRREEEELQAEVDRLRREEEERQAEEDRLRLEAEEKIRQEEERKIEAERRRKAEAKRIKAEKLEKIEYLRNQFAELSNEELAEEMNKTLERLQILISIQQKRI